MFYWKTQPSGSSVAGRLMRWQ